VEADPSAWDSMRGEGAARASSLMDGAGRSSCSPLPYRAHGEGGLGLGTTGTVGVF